MHHVAADVLVIEDGDVCFFRRGTTVLKFDSPGTISACKGILAAFAPPGQMSEQFLERFPETLRPSLADLVERMAAAGFLVPASEHGDAASQCWSDFGLSASGQRELTGSVSLFLIGRNSLSAAIAQSLAISGFALSGHIDDIKLRGLGAFDADWTPADSFALPADAKNPVLIAATDIGAETGLRRWNEFAIEHGVNFLPVSIKDLKGHVGPFVIPGHKPCYECARGRVNSNHLDAESYRVGEALFHTNPQAMGAHPLLIQMTAASAVAELVRNAGGILPTKPPSRLTIDPFFSQGISAHRLLRLPRCPACALARDHAPPLHIRDDANDTALVEAFK